MQDALAGDPFLETDGRYTKVQNLGAGSFGFVLLAKNRQGKNTAVKVSFLYDAFDCSMREICSLMTVSCSRRVP